MIRAVSRESEALCTRPGPGMVAPVSAVDEGRRHGNRSSSLGEVTATDCPDCAMCLGSRATGDKPPAPRALRGSANGRRATGAGGGGRRTSGARTAKSLPWQRRTPWRASQAVAAPPIAEMSAFARSHEATKAWWVALPLMKAERVLSTRWAGVSLTLPVYLLIMKGHFGWVPNAKPRSEYAWAGSVFGIPRISNLSTTSEPFPTQGLTLRPPALVKGALLPHLETDPYSGTWKSTSTGAVLRIAKVRNGWSVTDPWANRVWQLGEGMNSCPRTMRSREAGASSPATLTDSWSCTSHGSNCRQDHLGIG